MNETLEPYVKKLLDGGMKTAEDVAKFIETQTPELGKEMIAWGAVSEIVAPIIGLVIFFTMIVLHIKYRKGDIYYSGNREYPLHSPSLHCLRALDSSSSLRRSWMSSFLWLLLVCTSWKRLLASSSNFMKLPFELNRTYAYDELQELVASMCRQKPIVCFSIFESFDNSEGVWMVNAPDIESSNPVILGKVQFVADYWRVADEPVYSPVVENPTWRTIIDIFNDMLQQGDGCGIFLEGLVIAEPKDDINIIRFQIGS